MTPSRARIKTMTRLSLLDTCDQISNFFQFVARQCPPRVMGDNKPLASRLRQIRDVAGSVAVGTVGGSVAAVSTLVPSASGAIGTNDANANATRARDPTVD